MSDCNPLLDQVLENIAFSMHPIAGGDSFQTQSAHASLLQDMSHQHRGEAKAKEARELQIRSEGRQLGCLLVQRTKGETQLQVTKWLSATNGWEAWRQLNLSFLSKLLASLLQTSLDDQPASFLQHVLAWKERVVGHQELSGEQLPDSERSLNMIAIATCKEKKEKEELGEQIRVNDQASNNSLQQEQEQGKQQKLARGAAGKGKGTATDKGGAHSPQPQAYKGKGKPNQLPNSAQRACRDKPEETKGKGQGSNPSLKRELEQRGKSKEGRRKQQRKKKGEAYRPQPRAYQGKGEHQLPNSAHRACRDKLEPKGGKREKGEAYNPQPPWCNFCWKTGHTAQACWCNTSAQHQKHQQKKAWRSPRRKRQLQRDNGDQSVAD